MASFGGPRRPDGGLAPKGDQPGQQQANSTGASQQSQINSTSTGKKSDRPAVDSGTDTNPPPRSEVSIVRALFGPAFAIGAGNTFYIAQFGNHVLTLVYAGLAALSFLNSAKPGFVSGILSGGINNEPLEAEKKLSGFSGFIKEKVSRPGVCLAANGVAYAVTALGYLGWLAAGGRDFGFTANDVVQILVCGFSAVGEFAGAALCNKNALQLNREPWGLEKIATTIWSKIPTGVRAFLSDPGAIFSNVNVVLYGWTFYKAGALSSAVSGSQLALTAAGSSFTLLGAFFGICSVFYGAGKWGKPLPVTFNSIGNFFSGAAMISLGVASASLVPTLIGAASLLWAWGNGCYSVNSIRETFFTSKQNSPTPQ